MNVAKHVYYKEIDSRSGRRRIKPYNAAFQYKNTMYYCGTFKTIREAQIAVDKKLLTLGLEPLILRKRN